MTTSPTITELAKALVEAQGTFTEVAKTKDNLFFKSKYADLTAVVEMIKPIMKSNGLAIVQMPTTIGEHHGLTTRLMHESGEWIESTMRLKPAKDDPQGQGSAITYGRRYALCAILGIVADEDDDGNATSQPAGETGRQTTTKAPTERKTTRVKTPEQTGPKLNKLFAMLAGAGIAEDKRHGWAGGVLQRDVTSFTDLSAEDVKLLEKAARNVEAGPPTYADDDPARPF